MFYVKWKSSFMLTDFSLVQILAHYIIVNLTLCVNQPFILLNVFRAMQLIVSCSILALVTHHYCIKLFTLDIEFKKIIFEIYLQSFSKFD